MIEKREGERGDECKQKKRKRTKKEMKRRQE